MRNSSEIMPIVASSAVLCRSLVPERSKKLNTVVTGGAGFIGSHLVDELIARGDEVVVIDNLSTGRLDNLSQAQKSERFRFIEADIEDFDFESFFARERVEVVFHLAAQIDVRKSVEKPLLDARQNILATIRIAQAAATNGVRRIVHTSSGGSIYGVPDCFPVSEAAALSPESPYAASKAAGELYLKVFQSLYGLEYSLIAPSNVYGPRQNPNGEAGVVAIFSESLLSGRSTKLFGGGTNTRDYVYVGDVAKAFILASGEAGNGMRFNIGTSIETTDAELHKLVSEEVGVSSDPVHYPARLGDLKRSCLDYSRANELLGWFPQVDLRAGIFKTVEYFRGRISS